MRKVIYSMNVSLDGFIEGPGHDLSWAVIDEEYHCYVNDQERGLGAFLYGRRLWETMSAFWPTADFNLSYPDYVLEFAQIWKERPKIVFSTTLDRVEGNARLVKADAVEEVRRLKEQPGQDLSVGGAGLASFLMKHGLVDEYQPYIHPVVLGAGVRFFPDDFSVTLQLVDTKVFHSGVVQLRYLPAT